MEELMIVANVAIVFGVIYKLFELFVGRKERMMLIEKLPVETLTDEKLKNGGLSLCDLKENLFPTSSTSLRFGCLLIGLGLGLLAGYSQPEYFASDEISRPVRETVSIIYGACVLLGGGIGLIVAFVIEVIRAFRHK
jgi:hypothetical protein